MITAHSISHGGLGRFGNQCFTLAGTIGIATRNGQPYGFGPWRTVDNALFGDPVDDIEDYLVNPLPRVPEGLLFTDAGYHWEFRNYNVPTGNWNIQAHLQDPLYFIHCMDLIRETLRFKDEPNMGNWSSIHWRAGDYLNGADQYHPRQPFEYYKKAIELLGPDEKYFVFSDDIDTFSEMIVREFGSDPEGKRFKYVRGDYITSFKMMKNCKHHIVANSSYSYMAAILADHPEKKVIMPSLWFGSSANLIFDGYLHNAIII